MEANPRNFGLWLPNDAVPQRRREEPVELRHTGTYLTYSELTEAAGQPRTMTEGEIVGRLEQLSAADCMGHIAFLSSKMNAPEGPYFVPSVQRDLIAEVVGADSDLGIAFNALIERGEPTAIFCEQQLLHLARLVALHGDEREPDEFGGTELYGEWVTCLIGVTDLLDHGVKMEDPNERLSWELRQCGLNHHEDQLPVSALHHEIYRVLIPESHPEAAARIEAAFAAHVGVSMADYFVVGSAIQARFSQNPGQPIEPATYFASTGVGEETWGPVIDALARDQEGLRSALRQEETRYGPTTYGSLTFERFPLFEGQPGKYVAVSMAALQRRVTAGIFHLLAEAAEARGENRSTYTQEFGLPFQASVEQTLQRGNEANANPVPISGDLLYGPSRSHQRRSSDVILGFDRNPIFVEVVSGPLRIGTTTRGDLEDFEADVNRLIVEKARQLDTSISAFFNGELVVEGIDPAISRQVWPVIVTSHAFPHRDEINRAVEHRLAASGYLQDQRIGTLAVVSAEELFFCEGFMQRGETFLALIRGWKSDPGAAAHSFKNYLIQHGGGQAPGSDHFDFRFAEFCAEQENRLFDSERSPEEVLARIRSEDRDTR